jgi:hypothetical protein
LSDLDDEKRIKIIWNKNKLEEVERAREIFEKYKRQGWIAVIEKEGELRMIFDFDPEVECIILLPAYVGG